MKYPTLTELNASREMIDVFRGYNHNLRIGEGEFYDMTNLTSNDYPVLSPRSQRGVYKNPTHGTPLNPSCMISKDALGYVVASADNTHATFYYNDYAIDIEVDLEHKDEPKTLVSMGSYVIIMPDKYYINTQNINDKGKIEKTIEIKTGSVQFNLCKLDGEGYNIDHIGNTAPDLEEGEDEPTDLTLWLDTSGDTHVLRQYSRTHSEWVSIATTYIKISFPNESRDLKEAFTNEDGLTISGIKDLIESSTELTDTIKEQLEMFEGTVVAWEVGANYIVVKGILDKTTELALSDSAYISIKRQMPKMDFVIESGNRLWGCRYGIAHNNEVVNEIYCSKLGDFKNWNTFAGISTDSYVASVGSDGQFTGATTHLGYPIFFKENCMHKVYGNYPANYQIQTTACRGVQRGCSKSLAIVNEVLYYKSRSAICAYDGSLPVEVSSALGDVVYADAVAGVLGNKYYISMRDANETDNSKKYHLFVYDTQKGMWHREDNTQALEFCNCDGELYYIDYATNTAAVQIKTIRGTGLTDAARVKWEATTGIIGTDSPDKKYISRIVMRLSLEVGTTLYVQAQYDSSGTWEQVFAMSGSSLKTFSIPIRPKRCDHLRLRFIGEGVAKIFSITKTIEQGSDL